MLLRPRSPARADELPEVRFIEDDSAPEPVVEFANGLRMLLSRALEEYTVEWADKDEERHVILKGRQCREDPTRHS